MKTLRDITQAVAATDNLQSALSLLVSQTKSAMDTQCCSVYILEENQLVLSATDGLDPNAVGVVKMPLTQGLVGLVAEREEPINLTDAQLHPRFKLFAEIGEGEFRAFLAVPIIYQKRILGVLVVQQIEIRQFSEAEEDFLMTLAAQLAIVVREQRKKAQTKSISNQWCYTGTVAAKGVVIADAMVLGGDISLEQPNKTCGDIAAELRLLDVALDYCRTALTGSMQRFSDDNEIQSIFSALLVLLDETSLGGEYRREIDTGWDAITAVSRVSLRYIEQFHQMSDPYLRERANDIRDLGQRVLRALIEPKKMHFNLDVPVILVTREATVTMLAEFPSHKLAGIITEYGGVNSHAIILARAFGVPAVIGVNGILKADIDGKKLILNANRGQVLVSPTATLIQEYGQLISAEKALKQRYSQELPLPTNTRDGRRIKLYLNAGLLSSLASEIAEGTDGIGLYRTEIPFMLQSKFPSEAEQTKIYHQVFKAAGTRSVVMRTLDVGGDKPLPYFPIVEDNSSLGWRGIRLTLDHPELFLTQLRAMLNASTRSDQLHILLPMVCCLDEIDKALVYLEQVYQEIRQQKNTAFVKPKIGIMLEVPALLFQLEEVAKRVDFISVGSNDLTQYLLAVDRNNPKVSSLYDSYHPGVLRALRQICLECDRLQLQVSICGELAGEPIGGLLLVAMGYDRLSMDQGSVAKMNYLIRRASYSDLAQLLARVLKLVNGEDVRQMVGHYLEDNNLSEFL